MPPLVSGLLRAPMLLLLLAGCSGPPPAPLATPRPPASSASSASSEAEPEPAASAPVASGSAAPPPAVAEGPPSWVLVDYVGEGKFCAIQGALLLAPQEASWEMDEKTGYNHKMTRVTVVRNGKIEQAPPLEGPGYGLRGTSAYGRWPDHVELIGNVADSRTGYDDRYVLGASGWVHRDIGCPGRCRHDASWRIQMHQVGPRLVSLLTSQSKVLFKTAWGSAISPRLTAAPKECLTQENPPTTLLWPSVFGGLSDGTLISAGVSCTGEAMTEIWKPGESSSTLVKLPVPRDVESLAFRQDGLVTGVAHDAWLLAGRVFHYDGAWHEIPVPEGEAFSQGAVSRDGTLWALQTSGEDASARGTIWKRSGGSWTRVAVPRDFVPQDLAATEDGEVWAQGQGLLLRQMHPGETPLAALPPKQEDGSRIPPQKPKVTAGSERCHTNLVILFAFTKVTPEDYTFPLTGKALKGHTEFEEVGFAITRDGGKKYLAAQVSSYAIGKKLVALIETKIAGSRPQIVCAEPEIVRKLDLDAAAGELKRPD